MNNKYLYLVVAAILTAVSYYVGMMPYFADAAGGLSDGYWFGLILAVGLGAGSTGGDDVVSILVASITEYIPTIINLAIFAVVYNLVWGMGLQGAAFDVNGIIHSILTLVVSALFANAMFSYLRKAS